MVCHEIDDKGVCVRPGWLIFQTLLVAESMSPSSSFSSSFSFPVCRQHARLL